MYHVLKFRCRIEEAVQAVKDADAEAFRQALPKQLTLCQDLLSDLSAQPAGEAFLQQWVRSLFPPCPHFVSWLFIAETVLTLWDDEPPSERYLDGAGKCLSCSRKW